MSTNIASLRVTTTAAALIVVFGAAHTIAQATYRTVQILPGVSANGVETIQETETDWVLVNDTLNLIYARDMPRVAVIDGATNTVARHIDVGQNADSAAVDIVHQRLYLVHTLHRQVSVLDAVLENVINALDFVFTPSTVKVDPVREELYIAGENMLAITAARDGQRRILHTVTLPGFVRHVDVDPVRARVYALVGSDIVVIKPANGEILFTVPLPPLDGVPDFAVNPRTGFAYVTTVNDLSLVVLDVSRPPIARQPPIVAEVMLGEQTWSIDVDAEDNRVYVLEHQGPLPGTLWIVNGETHLVEHTIHLSVTGEPGDAGTMCWDSHHMDVNALTDRAYASCPIGSAKHVAVIPIP